MLGNVANDFTFIFASLYLQVFYTDVLGVSAGLVGTMFLYTTLEDGTIYAVCSFARKLGQAIASALGGWSLGWIGYVEGSLSGQTDAVRNGIYNIAALVPMILYLAVDICLIVIYPLSKKKVAENTAILKERRGRKESIRAPNPGRSFRKETEL